MNTYNAPAERQNKNELIGDFKKFSESVYIKKLINTLPFVAAILNSQRQIVFSNDIMLDKLEIDSIDPILGRRPGEILQCVNASKMEGGCGTSKECRYCGAVMAIMRSCETHDKSISECRITSKVDNQFQSYDFKVTASPLDFDGEEYTIFVLSDISSVKRKQNLERIFFHDVLNKAGVISGYLNFLEKTIDNKEKLKEYLKTAKEASLELNEEIKAQSILSQAESQELTPNTQQIVNLDIIESVSSQALRLREANGKKIKMDGETQFLYLHTDSLILKRILLNMIKNALEHITTGETVTIGCKLNNGYVRFYVINNANLNEETLSQIFQRSYSTKGTGRGVGTYSMRLLTENYLGGKSDFTYDNTLKEITFFVDIPVNTESGH
jgi:K+-sensing histidine kinase KdpD